MNSRGRGKAAAILTAAIAMIGLAPWAGCYGSPVQARVAATRNASDFACYAEPRLECPDRPRSECTGWDQRWFAVCPDDGSRWVCQYANSGQNRGQCRRVDAAPVAAVP